MRWRSRLAVVSVMGSMACSGGGSQGDSGPADASDVRPPMDAVTDGGDASADGTPADAELDASVDGGDASADGSPADGHGDVATDSGDGGMASLEGRWRLVRWENTSDAGGPPMLTDTNTTISTPAGPVQARVNGILALRNDRLALSIGMLANDHFLPSESSSSSEPLSAFGLGVPGTLGTDSFTIPGPMTTTLRFVRNPDGTITQQPINPGEARLTWARADSLPSATMLDATGYAWVLPSDRGTPIPSSPRIALAWDRPGGNGLFFTNDSALTFRDTGAAAYRIQVTAPPAEAIGTVGGVQVAVGYLLVYSDRDGNGRYDVGSDIMRGDPVHGLSTVAIAWRGSGTPSEAFRTSPVQDLLPGFQYVHVHRDYSVTGMIGVTPFDSTHPVAPDVAVSREELTGVTVPDLIR